MDTLSGLMRRAAFLALLFLGGFASAAGTVPMGNGVTQYTATCVQVGSNCPAGNGPFSTLQAACEHMFFWYKSQGGTITPMPPQTCKALRDTGSVWNEADVTLSQVPQCPPNSDPNGAGACTCIDPSVANAAGTACEAPPDKCKDTIGKHLTGELAVSVVGKVVPGSICQGGCTYYPTGLAATGYGVWSRLNGAWTYVSPGDDWVGGGNSCSPSAGPAGSSGDPGTPQTPPPKGDCPAVVNGVATTAPCDGSAAGTGTPPATPASGAGATPPASGGAPGSGSSTPPQTGPGIPGTGPGQSGGAAGSSATGSQTECTGQQCTTTTETNTTNPDGTVTTVRGSETKDKGTFCAENPGSPLCEKSSFAGACGGPASCTGDAIQCAMAAKQLEVACKLLTDKTAGMLAVESAMSAGSTPSGHPGASPSVVNLGLPGGGFDKTDLIGSGCPGDQSIPVFAGRSVTIPFSKLCTPAQWLGNIGVGICALACLGIVFVGGKKE